MYGTAVRRRGIQNGMDRVLELDKGARRKLVEQWHGGKETKRTNSATRRELPLRESLWTLDLSLSFDFEDSFDDIVVRIVSGLFGSWEMGGLGFCLLAVAGWQDLGDS